MADPPSRRHRKGVRGQPGACTSGLRWRGTSARGRGNVISRSSFSSTDRATTGGKSSGGESVGQSLQGRQLHAYTDEELQDIYSHYDQELAGELRRGAEPRFWEDVAAGDDLGLVLKGPLDILDNASFLGVLGGGCIAFADKWEMIRTELARSPRDPITRAYHYQMDWHLADSSAQAAGMPRAIAFGVYMEMNLTHLVNNWLGDHGWIQEFETRIGAPMFMGDTLRITGQVTRMYEEDGIGLAELEIRAVEQPGIVLMTARAVVRLPHRGHPNEVAQHLTAKRQS